MKGAKNPNEGVGDYYIGCDNWKYEGANDYK